MVEVTVAPGITAKAKAKVVNGRARLVELHVTAEDGYALSSDIMRTFPIRSMIRQAQQQMLVGNAATLQPTGLPDTPMPSRQGHALPREFFQQVAQVYAEAVRCGISPTQLLMQFYSVSRPTAQTYLRTARDLRMVPESTHGPRRTSLVRR